MFRLRVTLLSQAMDKQQRRVISAVLALDFGVHGLEIQRLFEKLRIRINDTGRSKLPGRSLESSLSGPSCSEGPSPCKGGIPEENHTAET